MLALRLPASTKRGNRLATRSAAAATMKNLESLVVRMENSDRGIL
jgi:hypothetical protein